ncbi:MAG: hypothetical protein Kow0068_25640 [Marinilabiliales bacterium]
MKVNASEKLMLAAAVLVMLNFNSCKKYDDGPTFSLMSKKARLTGEWEVVKIEGGQEPDDGELILEFEKNGDFKVTYDYGSYSYSYEGDWTWEDKKETLEIEIAGDKVEWEVKRLTNKELWFEDGDNCQVSQGCL